MPTNSGPFLCGVALWGLLTSCHGLVSAAAEPAAPTAPADAKSLEQQIRTFLETLYRPDQPGAAVIVVRHGEVVFRDAFGMADLELGVPLQPDMVFRLGSITKQFTGAAILLLEERGLLSANDPITRFLPDYPVHGHDLTVAHLLAHTSGIRSYTGIPVWMSTRIKADMSVEELIDGFKSEPMDFAPGERFLYNNSGYVLLGAIIERASGVSYAEFLKENIFEPLGMDSTYYGEHARIITRRASGYGGTPGDYQNAQYLSMTQPYAAQKIAALVIGDPFPERRAIELAPEVLERYTGVYRIDEDTTRVVTLEGDRLYTQRSGGPKTALLAESRHDFFYQYSFNYLSFVEDDAGRITHMLFYSDGSETPERAERIGDKSAESSAETQPQSRDP